MSHITENVQRILSSLPQDVLVVAAVKGRTVVQMGEAIEAGITILGANYVADTRAARAAFGDRVRYHFIGRLRPHDVRPAAVRLFDMVQSVGSLDLAERLDSRAAVLGAIMPVLVEVNSGREPQKNGVFPDEAPGLVDAIARLEHLSVEGLMTMGPLSPEPGDCRPAFAETRRLFETLGHRSDDRIAMRYLSMGMSDSYRVAIDEGANMVRLGSILFDGSLR